MCREHYLAQLGSSFYKTGNAYINMQQASVILPSSRVVNEEISLFNV